MSEATAEIIDAEVRRLIEQARGKAGRAILTAHMAELHKITEALLEYERFRAKKSTRFCAARRSSARILSPSRRPPTRRLLRARARCLPRRRRIRSLSEKGRASWPRFGRKAASWAFFVFFVLCFLVYPDGVFDSFQAADADDYLRLVRAREWLAGRGWFDDVIPRLGPGGGTAIPWSRLVDVPLAFAARLLFWLGVQAPWEKAALITPLFLCALLVPLGRTMARPFVPRAYAWLGPVVFFSCVSPFLFHFSPTRVDHNAFYLLLAGVGFAASCASFFVRGPSRRLLSRLAAAR
jgi:hypothetical protein